MSAFHQHQCIERDDALAPGVQDHRVEIDLANARFGPQHTAKRDDELRQRGHIKRRRTAIAAQDSSALELHQFGLDRLCGHVRREEAHVAELTANVAEGDFFEAADRFFAGDLPGTLHALQKHFFAGGDARPILSALQNRNRILLQARVLLDTGELRAPGPYGFDKAAHAPLYGGDTEKSSFNLFTQNQWYVGKLVGSARLPPLRRLIDHQQEFIRAFEEVIQRPAEPETVLREMAVRCLTA